MIGNLHIDKEKSEFTLILLVFIFILIVINITSLINSKKYSQDIFTKNNSPTPKISNNNLALTSSLYKEKILYSNKTIADEGGYYLSNIDGSEIVKLVDYKNHYAGYNRKENIVYFVECSLSEKLQNSLDLFNCNLHSVNLVTRNNEKILNFPSIDPSIDPQGSLFVTSHVSSDGKYVVFIKSVYDKSRSDRGQPTTSLYLYDIYNKTERKLFDCNDDFRWGNERCWGLLGVKWFADGESILFSAEGTSSQDVDIKEFYIDPFDVNNLIPELSLYYNLYWSNSGKKIATPVFKSKCINSGLRISDLSINEEGNVFRFNEENCKTNVSIKNDPLLWSENDKKIAFTLTTSDNYYISKGIGIFDVNLNSFKFYTSNDAQNTTNLVWLSDNLHLIAKRSKDTEQGKRNSLFLFSNLLCR